jgi:hypothetical protein
MVDLRDAGYGLVLRRARYGIISISPFVFCWRLILTKSLFFRDQSKKIEIEVDQIPDFSKKWLLSPIAFVLLIP